MLSSGNLHIVACDSDGHPGQDSPTRVSTGTKDFSKYSIQASSFSDVHRFQPLSHLVFLEDEKAVVGVRALSLEAREEVI